MLYLDTSVVVAALSNEAASPLARLWLQEQEPSELAISDWTISETSSALAIKVRKGEFTPEQCALALSIFNRMVTGSLTVLAVSREHFHTAALFAGRYELGLRAGDALHMAVAATQGACLYTLDKRLASAGAPLGVATRLLGG